MGRRRRSLLGDPGGLSPGVGAVEPAGPPAPVPPEPVEPPVEPTAAAPPREEPAVEEPTEAATDSLVSFSDEPYDPDPHDADPLVTDLPPLPDGFLSSASSPPPPPRGLRPGASGPRSFTAPAPVGESDFLADLVSGLDDPPPSEITVVEAEREVAEDADATAYAGAADTTDTGWDDSIHHQRRRGRALGRSLGNRAGPATPVSAPVSGPLLEGVLGDAPEVATAPDFFGDDFMGDAEEPPTEEMPSAVLEDLSQMYSAPMTVPEPPPLPGILDRFTPAPVQRRAAPPPLDLDDEPDPDEGLTAPHGTPPPERAIDDDADDRAYDDDDDRAYDDDESEQDLAPFGLSRPVFLALVGGGIFSVAMFVLLVAGMNIVGMMNPGSLPPEPEARSVVTTPAPPPVVVPPVAEEPEPVPEPEPEPERPPAPPKVVSAPAPAPAARPAPKPRPAPPAQKPAGVMGTLKIRSNQKALIKIDGRPVDYSPLDLPLAAGSYTISAVIPGRPDSEQKQQITLRASVIAPVDFSF